MTGCDGKVWSICKSKGKIQSNPLQGLYLP